jgi:hypothetical protein
MAQNSTACLLPFRYALFRWTVSTRSDRSWLQSREFSKRSSTAPSRGWAVFAVRPRHGNSLSVFRTGLLAFPVCTRHLSANPVGSIAVPGYEIFNLPRRVLRTDRGLKRSAGGPCAYLVPALRTHRTGARAVRPLRREKRRSAVVPGAPGPWGTGGRRTHTTNR